MTWFFIGTMVLDNFGRESTLDIFQDLDDIDEMDIFEVVAG